MVMRPSDLEIASQRRSSAADAQAIQSAFHNPQFFSFFLHPSGFPFHRKISASQGDVVGIWSLTSTLPREALAHRNHPGRTGGFSPRARRAFLSREADYRLDLQKTRRLLRRDDGFT